MDKNTIKKICLTFDVDFMDYLDHTSIDEMDSVFPFIQKVLIQQPSLKTTWFIRLDYGIENTCGAPDYYFKKHSNKLKWLLDNGHEIGWHYHAYKKENGNWIQNTDEAVICRELERYADFIKEYNFVSVRMGWGFHTNKTMKSINDLGLKIDSSAIPRPQYKWELSKKDWRKTGQKPYFPSINDYQIQGKPHLNIIEIPINTIPIGSPDDTESNIFRYINPAYHHSVFTKATKTFFDENNLLVMVCHPYEIMPNKNKHPLLSFDYNEFEKNLLFLTTSCTIKDLLN